MRAQKRMINILSLFIVFSLVLDINTNSNLFQAVVIQDEEFQKAFTLQDGKMIGMTSAVGNQFKTYISKFNIYESQECVEYCPLYEVLGNVYSYNKTISEFSLCYNQVGFGGSYDFSNNSLTLDQIVNSKIFEHFLSSYDVDSKPNKNYINNYLGKGQTFDLPESKIISFDIITELSSVKSELNKLKKLYNCPQEETTSIKNFFIIDLTACQEILKKKYNLPDNEDLWILKSESYHRISKRKQLNYDLFSTSLGDFLPLDYCKESGTTTIVTMPFNISYLEDFFKYKIAAVIKNGYNPFDITSPFFNDICTSFTNEHGNDVLLNERIRDYYDYYYYFYYFCEKGCTFLNYNESTNMYSCNCTIKNSINSINDFLKDEDTPKTFPADFYIKKFTYSNIKVFKCYSQAFSLKGQKMNFGSYALLACFIGFISMVVWYFAQGRKKMEDEFKNILELKRKSSESPQKDKTKDKEKYLYDDLPNVSNNKKDLTYNDEELNSADYEVAIEKDHRTFIQYYCSLLKLKQLCIFTFYTYTDHNSRYAKITLFTLFLSFNFTFTALFFNDSIMREIYIYRGNTEAALHIRNVFFSSLCTLIMSFFAKYVSLNERDIMQMKRQKYIKNKFLAAEKTIIKLKFKIINLFIFSGLLIGLCWYYIAAFCAVFKNSQGNYLINTLFSFIACNIWPCITCLIASIFRSKSFSCGSKYMYKFSQIISYL